jgi:hypothetical protein
MTKTKAGGLRTLRFSTPTAFGQPADYCAAAKEIEDCA